MLEVAYLLQNKHQKILFLEICFPPQFSKFFQKKVGKFVNFYKFEEKRNTRRQFFSENNKRFHFKGIYYKNEGRKKAGGSQSFCLLFIRRAKQAEYRNEGDYFLFTSINFYCGIQEQLNSRCEILTIEKMSEKPILKH